MSRPGLVGWRDRVVSRLSWSGVDGIFAALVVAIFVAGVVLSLSSSPSAAQRVGLDNPHYFLQRHGVAALVGVVVMGLVAASPLPLVRRVCFVVLGVGVLGVFAAAFWGPELNGAQRWLRFGPVSVQPIEFVKPCFICLCALAIAAGTQAGGPPGLAMGLCVFLVVLGGLALQPDVGQMALVSLAFAATALVAGARWVTLFGLGALGAGVIGVAAVSFPHALERVTAFLSDEGVFQVEQARAAIAHGGLSGVGPGAGALKYALPDGHGDYILAIAAEEFGALAVAALVLGFACLVGRALVLASRLDDGARAASVAALGALLGLQAMVNIAVTFNMAPAKGMTLPFVSYGGSSLVASGFAAGLILAFSRVRRDVETEDLGAQGPH